MDKIPDEVWWIVAIVVVFKVSSIVRALLPYEPGEPDFTDYGDSDTVRQKASAHR